MASDDETRYPFRRLWLLLVVVGCVTLVAIQAWRLTPRVVPRRPVTCELRGILDPLEHPAAERVELPGFAEPLALAEPASFAVRQARPEQNPIGQPVILLRIIEEDLLHAYEDSLPPVTWLAVFVDGEWVGREAYRWTEGPRPGEIWLGGPEGHYAPEDLRQALHLLRGNY